MSDPSATASSTARREPGRAAARSLAFLGVVYAARLAYQWLVVPTKDAVLVGAGAAVFLAVAVVDPWLRGETLESVGLTTAHLRRAALLVGPPTVVLVVALFFANAYLPGSPQDPRFWDRLGTHLPWALAQQGLLQPTFNRRLAAAVGPGLSSALLTGCFFAGMHLPNLPLTGATLVAGTGWALAYQRAPNLWAIAVSQGVLSAAAQSLLPAAWTHRFRVGPSFRPVS
jgi:hypothetical protein